MEENIYNTLENPTVSRVWFNSDAYLVCLTHALSTETEEIMGVCIGEVNEKKDANSAEILISHVHFFKRSDVKKDRVETSSVEIFEAFQAAENLNNETGRPLKVVGWYHSHPHITVQPSNIDLGTQINWQRNISKYFVGLIFSVFNEYQDNLNQHIELTCFQTYDDGGAAYNQVYKRIDVPIFLKRMKHFDENCLKKLTELPKMMVKEVQDKYEQVARSSSSHIMTSVHNASVFAQNLCGITETVTSPLLHLLHGAHKQRKDFLKSINHQNGELQKKIDALKNKKQTENLMDS